MCMHTTTSRFLWLIMCENTIKTISVQNLVQNPVSSPAVSTTRTVVLHMGIMKVWDFMPYNIISSLNQLDIYFVTHRQD